MTAEQGLERLRFLWRYRCNDLRHSFSKSFLRICIIALTVLNLCIPDSFADYKKDIGYTALKAEQGSSLPNGSKSPPVTQTEAATAIDHDGNDQTDPIKVWMPNHGHPEFKGKKISNRSGSLPYYSGHATGTGVLFYGRKRSMAPGIKFVESYRASHWLGSGFLRSESPFKPNTSPSRVGNHSWVASVKGNNPAVLKRIDWVVATDETTQVVGPCRPNNPLLGSAFNTIAVGQAAGENGNGTAAVDSVYTPGRTCPQLVAPRKTASAAAPVVAAAATLLIELGHERPALSTDPVAQHTADRNGRTVYNAERSEVIKAALMAGADRVTRNTEVIGDIAIDIVDYRAIPAHRAVNGLDRRYGAGQVNIKNSYDILAGGETNSTEDVPVTGGVIGPHGFDYDPAFGGVDGSNALASYFFTVDKNSRHLWAALVWNIAIDAGAGPHFVGTPKLYNLDLFLYDVTGPGEPRQVAASTSSADNTENLWVKLDQDHRYLIQVKPGGGQAAFKWDYALAWRIGRQGEQNKDSGIRGNQ